MPLRIFLFIAAIFLSGICQAQELLGITGGMNIPTAEMQASGTFRCGVNCLGKGIVTPEKGDVDYRWQFNYNTFNYYLNFTFFNWLEATFRETVLKSNSYGKYKDYKLFREQDRSITVKVRLLKDGRYHPAVAVGMNDPYSFTGHHVYSSVWGVATKNIHSKALASTWTATVGYMRAFDQSVMYDGLIAGLKFTPDFLPQASILAEYDSKGTNFGIQALLINNHLGFFFFTREFESFCGGIKYQTAIHF